MAKHKNHAQVMAVCVAAGLGLSACMGGPPGRHSGGHMPPPGSARQGGGSPETDTRRIALKSFDADSDTNITKLEVENGLGRHFAEMDADRSGALRGAEIAKAMEKMTAADPSMPPLRDWDQSGGVEFTEFSAWMIGTFEKADSDRDGVVTPAELNARPRRRRERRNGPPPGGGGRPDRNLSQSIAERQID